MCDQRCLRLNDGPQPGVLGLKLLPLWIEHSRVLPACARTVVDFRAIRANSYPDETVPEWLRLSAINSRRKP